MSPDKAAIEKLWEKHSFDYHEPGVRDPVRVMIKDDFLAALSEAEGERWISVEESIPKVETPVLIICRGEIRIGEIRWEHPTHEEDYPAFRYWDDPNDDGRDWEWFDVTHWQPLPAPPKEKP